jgi:hypothetical protein
MTVGSAPRHGLPFVPQPARDELLGSWLLRISGVYGLSMLTFLGRLFIRKDADRRVPHWFALRAADLQLRALANTLRRSPAELEAMAPPGCQPHWPQELGLCQGCLDDAAAAAHPLYWNRRWLHPLAMACSIHGTWLTPIAASDLSRVKHAAALDRIADRSRSAHTDLRDELTCVDDALWLQNICSGIGSEHPPWCHTPRDVMLRIVDTVSQAVMCSCITNAPQVAGRDNRGHRAVDAFTLEDEKGQRNHLLLPTHLRHRQYVLASVAQVLRCGPQARHCHRWPSSTVDKLASAPTKHWPAGAMAWICPKAAELARRRDELREELGISPRYFRAYSALTREFREAIATPLE